MPNNPGRIDGDYSIGEREEVRYVDPGNFGAVRHETSRGYIRYAIAAAVALAVIIILVAVR